MLKKILLTIFSLILIEDVRAYQCEFITPEKMLHISKFVFTAKILSKDDDVANVSMVKIYKGPALEKAQIIFPGRISKDYKLLENLDLGETYLFSTQQTLSENTKIIEIRLCNWKQNVKFSKPIIDSLEKIDQKK